MSGCQCRCLKHCSFFFIKSFLFSGIVLAKINICIQWVFILKIKNTNRHLVLKQLYCPCKEFETIEIYSEKRFLALRQNANHMQKFKFYKKNLFWLITSYFAYIFLYLIRRHKIFRREFKLSDVEFKLKKRNTKEHS